MCATFMVLSFPSRTSVKLCPEPGLGKRWLLKAIYSSPMVTLRLSGNPEADKLLSKDPLALLIGMVLDQQIPLEWAFAGPAELRRRLGHDLDAHDLGSMDPDTLAAAFSERPALHRYPGSMAG